MTKLIVDLNNILASQYLSQYENHKKEALFNKEDFNSLIRHTVLSILFRLKRRFMCDFSDMYLCIDNGSWRKDVYPYYKIKRKITREASSMNYDDMYHFFDCFETELRTFFDFKVLRVKNCEGDDCIAVLANSIGDSSCIISGDKDFIQCINDNVRLYNPFKDEIIIKKDFKVSDDKVITLPATTIAEVRNILFVQCLLGDKDDGVPNVKSDDDVFINPLKRQKPFGITAIKKEFLDNPDKITNFKRLVAEYPQNWRRNQTMIDLRCIPIAIMNDIHSAFVTQFQQVRVRDMNEYFEMYKLYQLRSKFEEQTLF